MEDILRKLSIAFTAGVLGAGARFAVLGAVDMTDLMAGYLPPLSWFLAADYMFQQIALGGLLGLALAAPLLRRFAILRGLVLAAGLTALMLLSTDLGAPGKLAALGEAEWRALTGKVAPIAAVSGLVWGCVAAFFYGAATKPMYEDSTDWDEADALEAEADRLEGESERMVREAVRLEQEEIARRARSSEAEPTISIGDQSAAPPKTG